MENKVSATLCQEDYDAIIAAVQVIKSKLPFGVSLTPEQRKALAKLGSKSKGFVDKAGEVASQNPQMLPGTLSLAEMQKDVTLFDQLYGIEMALSQAHYLVGDTCLQVGAEAFRASLVVYKSAKDHEHSLGLSDAVAELGERFAGQGKKKATTASAGTMP